MRPSRGHNAARGLVHASLGLAFIAGLGLVPKPIAVAALAGFTVCFLGVELARLRVASLRYRINARLSLFIRSEEETSLTGAGYFLIGSLVTAAAFPQELASLAVLFLALGDPVAAAVGRWKGRTRLWGRSVEGSLACLVVCLAAGGLMTTILGQPHITVTIVGALAATLFQALPLRLNDNVMIPIGSALAMMAAGVVIPAAVVF